MINKSVFEHELIAGMQTRLAGQNVDSLSSAVDYLNSAVEILDDIGMFAQADKILKILFKAATQRPVQKMISMEKLIELGISIDDIKNFSKNPMSRAKVNLALKKAGYTDEQIINFIGAQNVMSMSEINSWLDPEGGMAKIWKWVVEPKDIRREYSPEVPKENVEPGDDIVFTSIAKSKKPADPRKIPDPHTRGLTPDKMIRNLLHHGTEFNMADDNSAEDLLNAEVNDNDLGVTESDIYTSSLFEDE